MALAKFGVSHKVSRYPLILRSRDNVMRFCTCEHVVAAICVRSVIGRYYTRVDTRVIYHDGYLCNQQARARGTVWEMYSLRVSSAKALLIAHKQVKW